MKVSELFVNPFYYARELKPNPKKKRIDVKYYICRSKKGMENFVRAKNQTSSNCICELADGDDEAVFCIDMATGMAIPYEGAPHQERIFVAEDYGEKKEEI